MTQEEIKEGNKLIAEFMGGELLEGRQDNVYWFNKGHHLLEYRKAINRHAFKYHSSWDWLMPVVEKIESLGYGFTVDPWGIEIIEYISGNENSIVKFDRTDDEPKMEQYYYSVNKFIKWYNSLTTNNRTNECY